MVRVSFALINHETALILRVYHRPLTAAYPHLFPPTFAFTSWSGWRGCWLRTIRCCLGNIHHLLQLAIDRVTPRRAVATCFVDSIDQYTQLTF